MSESEKTRCAWARGPLMQAYHDQEWGRPLHDDPALFEMLLLEGFQAGLSWHVVLSKREAFRRAFAGFDAPTVAAFGEAEVARLLADAGIIRSRLKIEAAIGNARVFLALQQEFGSFDAYLTRWIPDGPVSYCGGTFPTQTPLSDAVSADLRRRGMKFMGSVTVYSFLQAVGIVNDHQLDCFVAQALAAPKAEKHTR